nr:replication protein A 70 kDa DNA-binding subunit B [Tanacetum cinerariifolium]
MAIFEVLDELMEITGSTELARKSARRRVLIREMEALGERGMAVDSLECFSTNSRKKTAKLTALTDAMTKTLAAKEIELNMTQLCDLDLMLDDIKILARYISIWKSHPAEKPNVVWSVDIILQDSQ